ncbi:MAG: HEAT repeat domain-containing protein [Victivallales bacterium]
MKNKFSWIYGFAAAVILLAAGLVVVELRSKPGAGAVAPARTDLHADKDLDAGVPAPSAGTLEKYTRAGNSSEKIAVLNGIAQSSTDKKMLELVYKALEDPDDDVRFAAAQQLDRFDANDVIPAISKALGDSNEEVRLLAVNALGEADAPETARLLAKGVGDDSEDVRRAVFSIAFTKDTPTREALLEAAVGSQYQDVKESLIDLAVDTPSRRTVETLLRALKDGDEELRTGIFAALEVFFSEEFKTGDDARNWWTKNSSGFDDELVEK